MTGHAYSLLEINKIDIIKAEKLMAVKLFNPYNKNQYSGELRNMDKLGLNIKSKEKLKL